MGKTTARRVSLTSETISSIQINATEPAAHTDGETDRQTHKPAAAAAILAGGDEDEQAARLGGRCNDAELCSLSTVNLSSASSQSCQQSTLRLHTATSLSITVTQCTNTSTRAEYDRQTGRERKRASE